jgi:hypothetical protein
MAGTLSAWLVDGSQESGRRVAPRRPFLYLQIDVDAPSCSLKVWEGDMWKRRGARRATDHFTLETLTADDSSDGTRPVSVDQRGSRVLETSECQTLLALAAASPGVGRIAVNGDPSPHVIPVNFSITDAGILVRLGAG